MSTILFDIFKKYFYPILSYKCSIIFCSYSPVFKKQYHTISHSFQYYVIGKMGKNRAFYIGGTKNQNKCSVFPAAYKLVHLHTNLIFKHSIQNLQTPTKSPFSHHPIQNPNIAPNIVKPN